MVIASTRWLAVRADFLCAVLISAVAFASVLLSQHPGKTIYGLNRQIKLAMKNIVYLKS